MVELLRQRLTNKEIALRLNLSEQTVKNHVHHVIRKVGAPNRFKVIEFCEASRTPEVRKNAPQPPVAEVERAS